MKELISETGIKTLDKKLINHSGRKTLEKKLKQKQKYLKHRSSESQGTPQLRDLKAMIPGNKEEFKGMFYRVNDT